MTTSQLESRPASHSSQVAEIAHMPSRPPRRYAGVLELLSVSLTFVVAATLYAQSITPPATDPALDSLTIVPWPKSARVAQGEMALSAKNRIVVAAPALRGLAEIFSREVLSLTGLRLAVATGTAQASDISLALDPALKGEAYVVNVTDRAVIRGADYNAVAMGTVTLLQSMEKRGDAVRLPQVTVEDGPQSPYCGMMLDIARKFHSLDVLRDCVEMCRFYKIHYFRLHMTDDQSFMFPSTAFPQLGHAEKRCYTVEELRALVKYADQRGVTLVPELELPGHAGPLVGAFPEVFGFKDAKTGKYGYAGMFNIFSEKAAPIIETLIGELCDVFASSPYIHLGGDEVGYYDREAAGVVLQGRGLTVEEATKQFYTRVYGAVRKRGKQVMVWEMPFDKEAVVTAWNGSQAELVKGGNRIVNVPWHVRPGRFRYEWNIWQICQKDERIQMERTPMVLGAEMVLWEQPGSVALPVLRVGATTRQEHVYNPDAGRTYEDFVRRFAVADRQLESVLYPVRVGAEGAQPIVGAPPAAPEEVLATVFAEELVRRDVEQRNILFVDELSVRLETPLDPSREAVRYTLDGTDPVATSPVYSAPLKITAKEIRPGESLRLRARLFVDGAPVGGVTERNIWHNRWATSPPTFRVTLYQTPTELKEYPADLSKFPTLYTGVVSTLNPDALPHIRRPTHCVMVFEGAATVAKEADYKISMTTADCFSHLYIDGKLAIDRKETYHAHASRATVHLTAGDHVFKLVRYGNAGGGSGLVWIDPGNERQIWDFVFKPVTDAK